MARRSASVGANFPCLALRFCTTALRVTLRHASLQCRYGATATKGVSHTRQVVANHRLRSDGSMVTVALVGRGVLGTTVSSFERVQPCLCRRAHPAVQ